MRVYVVSNGLEARLVRAPNRARALGHVARATLTVELATQEALIHLLTEGVSVEDVGADDVIDGGSEDDRE